MPVNVVCPACNNRGVVPDDTPTDSSLTCRACGQHFPLGSAVRDAVAPVLSSDPLAVWVGSGANPFVANSIPHTPLPAALTPENAAAHLEWLREETERFQTYVGRQFEAVGKLREQVLAFENKSRAEWVQKEQLLMRERALLNARAKELAAAEGKKATGLNSPTQDLQAELDRLLAVERESLTRRAEAVARSEEGLRQGQAELQQLQVENTVLRTAAQRDATTVAELRGQLADAVGRFTALAGQATEAERLRAVVESVQTENAELRATLTSAVERAAAALEPLRGEMAALREQLEGANERNTALAEQVAGQSETIERMTAAGQRLIKQRDALKEKLDRTQGVTSGRADPSAG